MAVSLLINTAAFIADAFFILGRPFRRGVPTVAEMMLSFHAEKYSANKPGKKFAPNAKNHSRPSAKTQNIVRLHASRLVTETG